MTDTATREEHLHSAEAKEIWALLREVADRQEKDRLRIEAEKEARLQREAQREKERLQREEERLQREAQIEKDRLQREEERQQMEKDRRQREAQMEAQMKETDRKIGELSNRFGELAEHLVAPNIMEKFNARGFSFVRVHENSRIKNLSGKTLAETDILLESDDVVMVVEVKAKPKQKDIDNHVARIEVLRRNASAHQRASKFLGAVAGAIMSDEMRDYIIENGFYAIEQTGDTVKISIPEGFEPREW
ncbi:MAG: hypothetical protein FWC65_04400 [Treponema sp.]|nr:hypothetical protein [Treponema sp.]